MPSEVMDQRRVGVLGDELRFPTERQVGFWKQEHVPSSRGIKGMPLIPGSKSASTSPMGKLHPGGPSSREHQELSRQYLSTGQNTKFGLEHHLVAAGSMNSSRASGQDFGLPSDHSMGPRTLLMGEDKVDRNHIHYENSLFSSSLSDLFDRKLKMSSNVASLGQSVNAVNSNLEEEEPLECSKEIEAHIIGNLLPDDDDDLFSGVIEDVGIIARPNFRDETDDDIFCSGGGMELEGDSDLVKGGLNSALPSGHPFGEQPSRTLFVTNMNSTVEDSELRMLFQQYGDIRSLYTTSKHQGFVMITYYDIRAAQSAIKMLQNKPLKGRKLDIHFSVPKDNPSEKDVNQGMLVMVNLDSSISGDDLRHMFGVYGEVKEICETPDHKFVEFYDVRAAEAARRALNTIDIDGTQIKVEPSAPGSPRWGSLMQQLPPELEREESSGFRQGISPGSSPIISKGFIPLGTITSRFNNGIAHGLLSAASAPSNLLAQINPLMDSSFHVIPPIASVGNHGDPGHAARQTKLGYHGMPTMTNGIGIPYNSSSIMPGMDINIASRSIEGVDTKYIQRVGSRGLSSRSFEHDERAYAGGPGNGSFPVHDPPYILNSPNVYPHHSVSPILWGSSSSFMKNVPSLHSQQMHGLPRAPSHMLNPVLPMHRAPHMGSPSANSPMRGTLHVGSAPVNPPIWDRRRLFTGDSAELLTFHPSSLGNTGFTRNSKGQLELVPHNILAHSKGNGINHVGISSPQQRSHMLNGRNRRSDPNANVADSKKQFELNIDRIIRGEDSRTTLMLKNIPNKYTSKMLLTAIDEHHKGNYDFIYLPIDFKNKCNVGYAFINMVEPQQIIPFFQEFNGKKWEKFNSEKVAFLAYARIQGKAALITHFQNSSLMNEDKRCRPILFHSDGPNAGDQEPFPAGPNIRSRPGRSKTIVNVECRDRSPSTSPTRADFASSSKTSD